MTCHAHGFSYSMIWIGPPEDCHYWCRCDYCRQPCSLGPANDDSEAVQLEIRALVMFDQRHAPDGLTDGDIEGYHDNELRLDEQECSEQDVEDWNVGYLAALLEDALIEHGRAKMIVRVTHMPTGISAECGEERSQLMNKAARVAVRGRRQPAAVRIRGLAIFDVSVSIRH